MLYINQDFKEFAQEKQIEIELVKCKVCGSEYKDGKPFVTKLSYGVEFKCCERVKIIGVFRHEETQQLFKKVIDNRHLLQGQIIEMEEGE